MEVSIDGIISDMSRIGYDLGEDEDCIRFDHVDGSTVEFDSWDDVLGFLSVHHGV